MPPTSPISRPPAFQTAGEVFGDFTLLRRLATGGMAEVFLARRRSALPGFAKMRKSLFYLKGDLLPALEQGLYGPAVHAFFQARAGLANEQDVRRPWRWALLAALSLHAGATEFFQQFVGRGSSLADVGLDHAGLVLGVALSWWRWLGITRSRPRP